MTKVSQWPRGVGNLQLCTNLPEVLRFQGVEFVTQHILTACFSHLQFKPKPNLQPAQLNHFPFLSQHKLQVALAAIHAPARRKFAGQEDPGHCRCSRCHRVDAGKSSDKRGTDGNAVRTSEGSLKRIQCTHWVWSKTTPRQNLKPIISNYQVWLLKWEPAFGSCIYTHLWDLVFNYIMTLIYCMNVWRLSQPSGGKCSLKPGRCWQSHGKHRKASVRDFRCGVVESYLVLSRST